MSHPNFHNGSSHIEMPKTLAGNKFNKNPDSNKVNTDLTTVIKQAKKHKEIQPSLEAELKIGDIIQLTESKVKELEKSCHNISVQGEVTSFHGKMVMVALGDIETLVMRDDIKINDQIT
ncbi:hypothetical protein HON22_04860 [Candidatus Peregrinibacteria bacterium]|jgi:hypothetical protein|nr:hypothetical protein [Candidatus Peregrinibacteria bacterium]